MDKKDSTGTQTLLGGVQPLWRTVLRFLKILNRTAAIWPDHSIPGYYPEGNRTNLHTCVHSSMNQSPEQPPKCPLTGEWMEKLMCMMEYYGDTTRNPPLVSQEQEHLKWPVVTSIWTIPSYRDKTWPLLWKGSRMGGLGIMEIICGDYTIIYFCQNS